MNRIPYLVNRIPSVSSKIGGLIFTISTLPYSTHSQHAKVSCIMLIMLLSMSGELLALDLIKLVPRAELLPLFPHTLLLVEQAEAGRRSFSPYLRST